MLKQKSFQAQQANPHFYPTQGPLAPKWYVVDAKDQVVGRIATVIARVLMGKHKPTFSRHADTGDFVIVLNADKVVFTRTKWDKKLYRYHTDYVGGLKTFTARDMLSRKPEKILWEAVWGMTGKTSLARHQMKKLKLYTGSEHAHQAQRPLPLPVAATRRTVLQSKSA
jgi:large subunit ribosomal protein L13